MTQVNNSSLYKRADKNNLYASIILSATIIITFFVTSNIYTGYIQYSDEKTNLIKKEESLSSELSELNRKEQLINNDKNTKDLLNQYASDYREDLILDQVYTKFDGINVGDISMDKGQKLPNGLNLASVSFAVNAKNIIELNKYLEYLTSKTANLRFVIKSASFPLNSENQNSTTQANLNLGMYYFENK